MGILLEMAQTSMRIRIKVVVVYRKPILHRVSPIRHVCAPSAKVGYIVLRMVKFLVLEPYVQIERLIGRRVKCICRGAGRINHQVRVPLTNAASFNIGQLQSGNARGREE